MMVDPVDRAGMTTDHGSAVTMIDYVDHVVMMIGPVSVAMMMVDPVDRAGMTTDHGSAATMIDRVDHAVMTTVGHVVGIAAHLVPVQLPSRRPMKSAIGVVDEG